MQETEKYTINILDVPDHLSTPQGLGNLWNQHANKIYQEYGLYITAVLSNITVYLGETYSNSAIRDGMSIACTRNPVTCHDKDLYGRLLGVMLQDLTTASDIKTYTISMNAVAYSRFINR